MNWNLFRVAGTNLTDFGRQCRLLERQLRTGSWPNAVIGSGDIRYAFVAKTTAEALSLVATMRTEGSACGALSCSPNVAFLFPGLGGELFERFNEVASLSPAFERILERADTVTSDRLGTSVSELVQRYGSKAADCARIRRLFRAAPASDAPSTVASHCILYTIECALAQTWIEWGVKPRYVMGYSLGEFSAACVAGLFNFEAGLTLLIDRAMLLAQLPVSGMISVSAPYREIFPVLEPQVHLVGENSPTQTILGADEPTLVRTAQTLRAGGYIVHELPVEHAFHTPLMQPVATRLFELFSRVITSSPQIPLVSTRTGDLLSAEALKSPAHWADHLCEPVRLRKALQTLERLECGVFLEIGPGQALAPVVGGHLQDPSRTTVVTTMPSEYDAQSVAGHILRTAGRLWTIRVPVESVPTVRAREQELTSTTELASGTFADVDESLICKVREIWSAALGRQSIGLDDDFFALGGSSLKAARIAMEVERQFHLVLTLRDIYSSPTPRKLTELIFAGERLQMGAAELMTLPNGLIIRYQSRAEASYFYRTIFEERCYLRHGVCLSPGASVVDVGANIGMFSIFAALQSPGIRLFSFEPVLPLFEILQFNLTDICEGAMAYNVGLSDKAGKSVITYYPNSPGMSSFLADRSYEQAVLEVILRNSLALGDSPSREILQDRVDFMESRFQAQHLTCALRTLSDVFDEQGIGKVDLLKIDVQKFEMKVLHGISDEHWTRIHQTVIEVHDQNGRLRDVHDLLQSRGFKVVIDQDPLYQGTDVYNLYACR